MIKETVNSIIKSLENSKVNRINGNTYQSLENVFDEKFLDELKEAVRDEENFESEHRQFTRPRKKLKQDHIINKKLILIFSHTAIKNFVEKNYDIKVGNIVPSVWIDYEGYFLERHTDDYSIGVAMQIYLDTKENLGTQIYKDMESTDPIETFHYELNKGYVMINNDKSYHQTEGTVPANYARPSVYVRFRKEDYNVEDYKDHVY